MAKHCIFDEWSEIGQLKSLLQKLSDIIDANWPEKLIMILTYTSLWFCIENSCFESEIDCLINTSVRYSHICFRK